VELADMIDWGQLIRSLPSLFSLSVDRAVRFFGRGSLPDCCICSMHSIIPDEQVVAVWLENPYWHVLTGETHLQTEPPIAPSSLWRWRQRLGEVGMEELLAQSIEAAKRAYVIKPSSVQRVIVDTTVIEKAVAYPTDSALLERSRKHLVKAAGQCSLYLRQNDNREAPRLVQQIVRYAHAKQFRRMCAALRPARAVRTSSPRYRSTNGSSLYAPAQAAR
jgi:IS5 family transposase